MISVAVPETKVHMLSKSTNVMVYLEYVAALASSEVCAVRLMRIRRVMPEYLPSNSSMIKSLRPNEILQRVRRRSCPF